MCAAAALAPGAASESSWMPAPATQARIVLNRTVRRIDGMPRSPWFGEVGPILTDGAYIAAASRWRVTRRARRVILFRTSTGVTEYESPHRLDHHSMRFADLGRERDLSRRRAPTGAGSRARS